MKEAAAIEQQAPQEKNLSEMTLAERKKLRQMRFKTTGDLAATNTLEMREKHREEKEKMLARAQRFGIVTKEMNEERIKER